MGSGWIGELAPATDSCGELDCVTTLIKEARHGKTTPRLTTCNLSAMDVTELEAGVTPDPPNGAVTTIGAIADQNRRSAGFRPEWNRIKENTTTTSLCPRSRCIAAIFEFRACF